MARIVRSRSSGARAGPTSASSAPRSQHSTLPSAARWSAPRSSWSARRWARRFFPRAVYMQLTMTAAIAPWAPSRAFRRCPDGGRARHLRAGLGRRQDHADACARAPLAQQRMRVQCFKSGPDYIDPAFHAAATGRASVNVDSWAMPRDTIETLVARAKNADLVLAEGSMGLFDGVATPGKSGTGASGDLA